MLLFWKFFTKYFDFKKTQDLAGTLLLGWYLRVRKHLALYNKHEGAVVKWSCYFSYLLLARFILWNSIATFWSAIGSRSFKVTSIRTRTRSTCFLNQSQLVTCVSWYSRGITISVWGWSIWSADQVKSNEVTATELIIKSWYRLKNVNKFDIQPAPLDMLGPFSAFFVGHQPDVLVIFSGIAKNFQKISYFLSPDTEFFVKLQTRNGNRWTASVS